MLKIKNIKKLKSSKIVIVLLSICICFSFVVADQRVRAAEQLPNATMVISNKTTCTISNIASRAYENELAVYYAVGHLTDYTIANYKILFSMSNVSSSYTKSLSSYLGTTLLTDTEYTIFAKTTWYEYMGPAVATQNTNMVYYNYTETLANAEMTMINRSDYEVKNVTISQSADETSYILYYAAGHLSNYNIANYQVLASATNTTNTNYFTNSMSLTSFFGTKLLADTEYTLFWQMRYEDYDTQLLETKQNTNLIYVIYQTPVPLPANPTKPGYTFVGWYYDAALSQAYDGAPIYEDISLYAKFEINQYTVTFDSQGGSDVASITQEYNTTITTPANPERFGHTFAGWYTDAACTQAYNINSPLTADITLYAKWNIEVRNVTFIVDGAVYTTLELPYGASLKTEQSAANYVAAMGDLYTDAEKKTNMT